MTDLDPLAALQHRNRETAHDVKGLFAALQNAETLYERDGNPDSLLRTVRFGQKRCRDLLQLLEPAVYDYELHSWEPSCPFGDECTGCDAVGRCTRMEG